MGYCIIPLNLEIHNFRNLYGLMCIKRVQNTTRSIAKMRMKSIQMIFVFIIYLMYFTVFGLQYLLCIDFMI